MRDLILIEDVTGPASPWRVTEHIGGRHLMTLVFRVECTRQTTDGEQAIITLAD
jgi:hypothetical protein